jgi:Leucine-rich repeat (LRR) protein
LGKNWTNTSWRRFCTISRLQSLAELDLSNNPLGFLPVRFFILFSQIHCNNLQDAFINSLPPSLKVLMLANCRLDRLSNRISRLQNLQVLSISNNPMEEIPEDVSPT